MSFQFFHPIGSPNIVATLVMVLWIPLVIWIFQRYPARRAIVISFIAAWLFLPVVILELPGIPNYSKISATSYGVLLATFIFDVGRFKQFKFGLLDIPIALWCICPLFSSFSNELGIYDGISAVTNQTMTWGIPYFLGRIYLSDLEGLRQLAIGIFAGGLVYVPLCLFEIRMSPQLHNILYGGHPHGDFGQTIRIGGFRPTVFMQHGLAVGAWMMAALLIGIWLWRTGTKLNFLNFPFNITVPLLFLTFLALRSTGAYGLLALGIAILYIGAVFRTALPVYLTIAGLIIYLYLSTMTESYITDQIIGTLSQYLPEDRVQSLEFRFNNEEVLVDRARERLWLGWAGWGRALVYDAQGKALTIQDSLWIIAFGHHGFLGLVSLYTTLLLPIVSVFTTKCPPRLWQKKEHAPVAVLTVTLLLYSIDCLLNAMINPLYILICGGLTGYVMRSSRSAATMQTSPKSFSRSILTSAELTKH
ncbi:hypothetical protein [Nodosilinea sp. E11]|uniref:hypothetical protein n=1 Tax=Nodosilinea sp. E11 TaxID=3037479 RepID=UPI002934B765|nr:hypothetical protein [Nodosilinea sp. E11]WOD39160.1 hypothetical protein RRF56_23415 [Nodosilinea sp. E11]